MTILNSIFRQVAMMHLWDVPEYMTLCVGWMEILTPVNASYALKTGEDKV